MWGSSRRRGASLAAALPALAVGLAAGVTGGVYAAGALDTTPYNETQYNTAVRNGHQAGRAQALAEAEQVSARVTSQLRAQNADRVERLESRLAKAERSLKQVSKQSKQRQTKIVTLHGALAETSAALGNATSGTSGDGQAVEGTLTVRGIPVRKGSTESANCAESLRTYQVRVTAGTNATVATARLQGGNITDRVTERGRGRGDQRKPEVVSITCSLTYAADLPTPLGSAYRFVVSGAGTDSALDARDAPGAALRDGSGPALSVSR